MIAFLIRGLGVLLFAASFIALVADGIRSLAADAVVLTPLGQTWFQLHPGSLNLLQAVVQRYLHPYIWDPILLTVLLWPTFAVGGGLGILLMVLGRKRRRAQAF
ncbi:hypothetical protein [Chthonobacter rhizosphaerae]|uniref:hypothetical protein n=1 Tax=Chthonobacter rhizosphaerae TaxID=2735553 RepID=UPI001AEE2F24|nr:hypothetical protein [Chthonobacter rhizosphaerae]